MYQKAILLVKGKIKQKIKMIASEKDIRGAGG
jgi:hypothetical protein